MKKSKNFLFPVAGDVNGQLHAAANIISSDTDSDAEFCDSSDQIQVRKVSLNEKQS